MFRSTGKLSSSRFVIGALAAGMVLAAAVSTSQAALTDRYSFTTDASDSVGSASGTLMNVATVSGGALQLNNPNFSGPSSSAGFLSIPASVIPSSGSVTIESWFTFGGSGFFTEDWTLTDGANDTNPPGSNNGQYLMHVISAPAGGPNPAGGGSHVSQSLAGFSGGETDAFGTTAGIGAGGGGFLDDGESFMSAVVIDGSAGTLSYYLYDLSAGGLGGLQDSITAIPLSSFAFTNLYLGRSAFPGDNATNGSIDEFRIYNDAQSAAQVAADQAAGPDAVIATPEPASLALLAVGGLALINRRRRA